MIRTIRTYNAKVAILWRSLIEAGLSIVVRRGASGELIGACLNFDARADEAQPLCACAAFSRNHAGAEAATAATKEGESDEQKAAKRPSDGDFARKKRSRTNTAGDSAFASDNDDDEMSESSGAELDTTPSSSIASTEEDEMVRHQLYIIIKEYTLSTNIFDV